MRLTHDSLQETPLIKDVLQKYQVKTAKSKEVHSLEETQEETVATLEEPQASDDEVYLYARHPID